MAAAVGSRQGSGAGIGGAAAARVVGVVAWGEGRGWMGVLGGPVDLRGQGH